MNEGQQEVPDQKTEKSRVPPVEKGITEKLSWIAVNTIQSIFELPEKSVVRRKIYEGALDTAILGVELLVNSDLRLNSPKNNKSEKNKARRPFGEIIEDGIYKFKEEFPGTEVKLGRDPGEVMGAERVTQFLASTITESDLDKYPEFSPKVKGKLIGKTRINALLYLTTNGSEKVSNLLRDFQTDLLKTFSSEHGSLVRNSEQNFNNFQFQRAYDTKVVSGSLDSQISSSIVSSVVGDIEKYVIENGVPCPTSHIFKLCLQIKGGLVYPSLKLLSDIYKAKSRGNIDSGSDLNSDPSSNVDDKDTRNALWMKKSILDEFSEISFNSLTDGEIDYPGRLDALFSRIMRIEDDVKDIYYDLSLKNLTGLPYHTVYLIALSEKFSPEMIAFMTLGEYLRYGSKHGLIKFLSDLRVLRDIWNIRDYLDGFKNTPV